MPRKPTYQGEPYRYDTCPSCKGIKQTEADLCQNCFNGPTYTDEELAEWARKVNDALPYAIVFKGPTPIVAIMKQAS